MKAPTYVGIVLSLIMLNVVGMWQYSLGYILCLMMFVLLEGDTLFKKDVLFVIKNQTKKPKETRN